MAFARSPRRMRAHLTLFVLPLAFVFSCSGASSPGGFAGRPRGSSSGGGGTAGAAAAEGPARWATAGGRAVVSIGDLGEGGAPEASATTTIDGGSQCVKNASQCDIPANGCDDDDDGTIDNVLVCDGSLTLAGAAGAFLQAMGVCRVSADANHWGVVSATYTNGHTQTTAGPDNFGQQHGILTTFGSVIVPREGVHAGRPQLRFRDRHRLGQRPRLQGEKNGMQGPAGLGPCHRKRRRRPHGLPAVVPGRAPSLKR